MLRIPQSDILIEHQSLDSFFWKLWGEKRRSNNIWQSWVQSEEALESERKIELERKLESESEPDRREAQSDSWSRWDGNWNASELKLGKISSTERWDMQSGAPGARTWWINYSQNLTSACGYTPVYWTRWSSRRPARWRPRPVPATPPECGRFARIPYPC